ncbi:MAG: hypothetical protein SO101_07440, partial [Lachnospiraceae bacterium]|nr:hypothetical protein [Lachnospiraceae bacterium]
LPICRKHENYLIPVLNRTFDGAEQFARQYTDNLGIAMRIVSASSATETSTAPTPERRFYGK